MTKTTNLQIEIIFNNILHKDKTITNEIYEMINKNLLIEIGKEINHE